MGAWNAMTYEGKDNLLNVVRREAERMFALAEQPDTWESPTACPNWQVRDVVGHIVDVTEGYFVGFDAARGGGETAEPLGLPIMAERLDERARAFRSESQQDMVERLRSDFDKMMEIEQALGPDDWAGLTVSHGYMGPLPAFFYPSFQLMDYGVHSWDIRQGTGRSHSLPGDVADLLAPFLLIVWQSTCQATTDRPFEIGVRIFGTLGGEYRFSIGPEGVSYEPADVAGLPTVLEFDPSSFVLTAFGRMNAGTVRGDSKLADRFLNSFFRI